MASYCDCANCRVGCSCDWVHCRSNPHSAPLGQGGSCGCSSPSCPVCSELPGKPVAQLYFPPYGAGGKDGIPLRVEPQSAAPWIGRFAFGHVGGGLSAVIASPQPQWLFVISDGQGYEVNTAKPSEWNKLPCIPVRDVRVIHEHNLVLFADFTNVCGYGNSGLCWCHRVCADDLAITEILKDRIMGTGYDPTGPTERSGFELEIPSGNVVRAAYPWGPR